MGIKRISYALLGALLCSANVQGQINYMGDKTFEQLIELGYEYWDTATIKKEIARAQRIKDDKPDSAIYILRDAARKSIYLKNDDLTATALLNLGTRYLALGQYTQAQQYYQKAIPYTLRAYRDKDKLAIFYANLSFPYAYKGRLDSMAFWLYKAEEQLQNYTPTNAIQAGHVSTVYASLGGMWNQLDNVHTALRYFTKAIAVALPYKKHKEIKHRLREIYNNTGHAYAKLNLYDSASYCYQQALAMDPNYEGALIGQGYLLIKQEQPEKALPFFNKALQLSTRKKDQTGIIQANLYRGKVLHMLNNPKALGILKDVVSQADKMGLKNASIYSTYTELADIYASQGNNAAAYAYQRKGIQLLNTLLENEKKNASVALEIKSQTAQKNIELAQKQLMLTRRESQIKEKNIWIGAITVGALLSIALLISLYRSKLHKQKMLEGTVNSMMQEQEISNLQAIMKGEEKERTRLARDLHDGIMVQLSTVLMNLDTLPQPFKTINSEEYFATPYYRQMVDQLSHATKELRKTAHNLMPDMLLEGGLIEAVSYFCKTLQQSLSFQVSFQQHGKIPRFQPEFEISVYRIIQELVQNIIKHAQASKAVVQIANFENNMLTVIIEDDGIGITTDKVNSDMGMGLKSIKGRVKVLNGTMELLSSLDGGTTVYLEFDIANQKEN